MENDTRVDISALTDPRKAIICTMVQNGMMKVMTEQAFKSGVLSGLDPLQRETALLAMEKYTNIAVMLTVKTEPGEEGIDADGLKKIRAQGDQLLALTNQLNLPLLPLDMMMEASAKDAKNLLHVIEHGDYDPEVGVPDTRADTLREAQALKAKFEEAKKPKLPKLVLPDNFNRGNN